MGTRLGRCSLRTTGETTAHARSAPTRLSGRAASRSWCSRAVAQRLLRQFAVLEEEHRDAGEQAELTDVR